jgi:cytochrome P450
MSSPAMTPPRPRWLMRYGLSAAILRYRDRVVAEVAEVGVVELTPDDMSRLTYTVQVLHEARRLCPPGATGARMAMQDVEIDGYRVEAGTMLLFGIMSVQRDPALWDNPLTFDPDRFSPDNSKGRDHASAITSPC